MKRRESLFVFVITMLVATQLCHSESFNFDSLYPKSFCTKATEHCVSIWGAWDNLLSDNVSSLQYTHIIDRSIGQLVLVQRLLLQSGHKEKKPVKEQLHYLSRVIGTIADRLNRLPHLDADRAACLKKWVAKIKQLVQHALYKE